MKIRSPKDIEKALLAKGFEKGSSKKKSHHHFYNFIYDSRKTGVYTFLSHGSKHADYSTSLMNKIKHQLKFKESSTADAFLDCPFKQEQYIDMLRKAGEI